jgi:hypothetical protein
MLLKCWNIHVHYAYLCGEVQNLGVRSNARAFNYRVETGVREEQNSNLVDVLYNMHLKKNTTPCIILLWEVKFSCVC